MIQNWGPAEIYSGTADVLRNLSGTLYRTRINSALSMQAAAEEIGVCSSTVCRLEHGESCTTAVAVAVLRWLAAKHA